MFAKLVQNERIAKFYMDFSELQPNFIIENDIDTNKKCNFAPVMEKKRRALRKLLEAVEHELLKKPNRKTLDRLSLLAGYQDWESFQDALHGVGDGEENYEVGEKPKK